MHSGTVGLGSCPFAWLRSFGSGMQGLIHTKFSTAGEPNLRTLSPAQGLDRAACNVFLLHGCQKYIDVFTGQVDFVNIVLSRRMNRQLCGRESEDEPAITDVYMRKPEYVSQEGAVGLRFLAIDDGVGAGNHCHIGFPYFPRSVAENTVPDCRYFVSPPVARRMRAHLCRRQVPVVDKLSGHSNLDRRIRSCRSAAPARYPSHDETMSDLRGGTANPHLALC
jgi:hypothetical protein